MLIVNITVTELNTMSSRDAVLICEDSEFSEDILKDMVIDLRLSASHCIDYFREIAK